MNRTRRRRATLVAGLLPIDLVEAFHADPETPWLGRFGLGVTIAVFIGGCVFLGVSQARELDFVGTPLQFGVTVLAVAGLAVTGFSVAPRPPGDASTNAAAPAPWLAGFSAFAVTSLYWLGTGIPGTLAAVTCFALGVGVCVALIRRWSGRRGWSGRHRVALATGAAATYALWFGPSQANEAGTGPGEAAVGAVVFGIVVGLIALAGSARQRL